MLRQSALICGWFPIFHFSLFSGALDTALEMTSQELEESEDHRTFTTAIPTQSWTSRVPAVPTLTRWTPAGTGTGAGTRVGPRTTPWPRHLQCLAPLFPTLAGQLTQPSPLWQALLPPLQRLLTPPARCLSTKLHHNSGLALTPAPLCPLPLHILWTPCLSPSPSPFQDSKVISSNFQLRLQQNPRPGLSKCSDSAPPRDSKANFYVRGWWKDKSCKDVACCATVSILTLGFYIQSPKIFPGTESHFIWNQNFRTMSMNHFYRLFISIIQASDRNSL